AAVLFLALHHLLVEPIWLRGLRGVVPAVAGGALVGIGYAEVRDRLRGPPALRGVLYGAFAALTLLPFVAASALRVGGLPLPAALGFVAVPLVVVLALLFAAMRPVEGEDGAEERRRFAWGAAGLLAVNAYPGFFLLALPNLVEGRVPNPWPMPLALMVIFLLSGALLEGLASRPARTAA
ncbi:MAG TPA: hypothetical protein VNZ52_10185, partial [Candidatus Thermoplasmatota archaeon]|nr:hypothetical protein [Candidatus Thermoplasmatota archaeon]